MSRVFAKSPESWPTVCDPVDCNLRSSSVPEILQTRILEWGAIPFYRVSSWPMESLTSPTMEGGFFTTSATWEALDSVPKQLFFFLPAVFFISWRLITLQYCSGFYHTLTWISHGFTCVPHSEPPSHLPPHPIPLGHLSAPALSTCLMHPTWTGDLFHPW